MTSISSCTKPFDLDVALGKLDEKFLCLPKREAAAFPTHHGFQKPKSEMDRVRFADGLKRVGVCGPCHLPDLGLTLETMQLWLPSVLQQEHKLEPYRLRALFGFFHCLQPVFDFITCTANQQKDDACVTSCKRFFIVFSGLFSGLRNTFLC